MKIWIIVGIVIVALIFLSWLGLQIKPKAFPPFAQRTPSLQTVPLPEGLPAPVERYYRLIYGDRIPLITSAVITGHANMRIGSINFPARLRFTHVAGKAYRHYIEITFFGFPIMVANERYVDGKARMELPFGVDEGDKLNQAANLGMWSESAWFPAIFLTDPRVHWQAVDENTALLIVPFEDQEERYVVRFDPQSGLTTWFESMRYQDSKSKEKVLWLNQSLEWGERDGRPYFISGAATWMNDGKPWAVFTLEDLVLNVDVEQYVRQKGL
jgi:hypothetical protein